MINFVATGSHLKPHEYLHRALGAKTSTLLSYDTLFSLKELPGGTWIFSDFDRLGFYELELAAACFQQLKAHGARVLNDPARFVHRAALLRRLHETGVNSFRVWRPEDGEKPDRFPVFIRYAPAHRGALTELLHSAQEVEQALETLLAAGAILHNLLIVEFRAEHVPGSPGVYRKYAAYKAGKSFVPALIATETSWVAKVGQRGLVEEDVYEADAIYMRERPHEKLLMDTFALANVDFGRLDYAIVDGRVEIYEINTNPLVADLGAHPSPARAETLRTVESELLAAMRALDSESAPVSMKDAYPNRSKNWRDRVQLSRWVP